MNVSISCDVCFEDFDYSQRVPRILTCGHSFCTKCIKGLSELICPTCRVPETKSKSFSELTINYQLIPSMQKSEPKNPEPVEQLLCSEHKRAECFFFCNKCQLSICRDCTVITHRVDEHDVISIEEAICQKQKECEENVQQNLQLLKDAKSNIAEQKRILDDEMKQLKDELDNNLENSDKQFTEEHKRLLKAIEDAKAKNEEEKENFVSNFERKTKLLRDEKSRMSTVELEIAESEPRMNELAVDVSSKNFNKLLQLQKRVQHLAKEVQRQMKDIKGVTLPDMIGVPSRRPLRLCLEWRSAERNAGGRFEFEFFCTHDHGANFLENVARKSLIGREGIVYSASLLCSDVPRCIDGNFEDGMEEPPEEFKEGQMIFWPDGHFSFFHKSFRPFGFRCCVAGQISPQQLKEANLDSVKIGEEIEFTSIDFVE